MNDDQILRRIAEAKKARKRSTVSNGHNIKVLRSVLGRFMRIGGVYPLTQIELFIEKAGLNYSSAGPATTYGVREGYLERVGKGQYKVLRMISAT
jgi:hypothetical protein